MQLSRGQTEFLRRSSGDRVRTDDASLRSRTSQLARRCALALSLAIIVTACGDDRNSVTVGEPMADEASLQCTRDIDALERTKAAPPSCASDSQCIDGSRCDASSGTCVWDCLSSTDCGSGFQCTCRGTCEKSSAAALSVFSVAAPGCTKNPDELATLDQSCFSAPCVCGSHCDQQQGRCEYECIADEDCSGTGEVCDYQGFCVTPSSPSPTVPPTVAMQVSPLARRLRPTAGAAIAPVGFDVTLTTPVTPPAELSVRVVPSVIVDGNAPTEHPTVRCAATGAFADSCELAGPWTFSGTTIKTATANVAVQLPPASTDVTWTLEFRSNHTINPVASISIEVLPQAPVPVDGDYAGTIARDGVADAERYPVRAVMRGGALAIVDDARVVSARATVSVQAPYAAQTVGWANGSSTVASEHAIATLTPTAPVLDPVNGELTGTLRVVATGGVDVTWRYHLVKSGPVAEFSSCSATTTCAAGLSCELAVARCLPTSSNAQPGSQFVDTRMRAWTTAANAALPSYLQKYTGAEAVGRTVCHQSGTADAGDYLAKSFITVGTGTALADVGELACDRTGTSEAFPFLRADRAFAMSSTQDVMNLLRDCVDELAAAPGSTVFGKAKCVSLSRVFRSLGVVSAGSGPEVDRMLGFLLRNWLEVHELVGQLGDLDYGHARALSSAHDQLLSPAPEATLDVLERGWDLVLDTGLRQRVLAASTSALAAPDYRPLPRPIVYWSFNQESPAANPMAAPDVARGHNLQITGPTKVWNFAGGSFKNMLYVYPSGSTQPNATCRSDVHADLVMEGDYTVFANIFLLADGAEQLVLRKTDDSFRVSVTRTIVGSDSSSTADQILVKVKVGAATANFNFYRGTQERGGGNYALVHKNGELRLYGPPPTWDGRQFVLIGAQAIPRIPAGTHATGQLEINCARTLIGDDFLVFDRALDSTDLDYVSSSRASLVDIGFPLPIGPDSQNPAYYDGVALQIAATANQHLELFGHWLRDQTAALYGTCHLGQSSPARTAVLERVGRTLRRIADAEHLADQILVGVDLDAMPWADRYRSQRTAAQAARGRIARHARQLQACENPLGIGEADLPMYYKFLATDTPQDAYFGSSRYLLTEANKHIDHASARLSDARGAWLQARTSVYQAKLTASERALRIAQIKAHHESALTELCGKPASSSATPLLDSVLVDGAVDYNKLGQCYVDTSACSSNQPVGTMPAHCLRGGIGEQVLVLQGAMLATTSARNALERANEQYKEAGQRCAHKQEFYAENERILDKFNGEIAKWRRLKMSADMLSVGAKTAQECSTLENVFSFGTGCAFGMIAAAADIASLGFQEKMASVEADFQENMTRRGNQEDVRDCWFEAEQHKHVIAAQYDALKEASHAILGVQLQLQNMTSQLAFVAEQAKAALAIEDELFVDSPQHHFWFDDEIAEYQWSFEWAKRLTYLAMRSAEYELQQSLGLRGAILAARQPFELEQIHDQLAFAISQGQANGHDVEFQPLVISLRQQILRIAPTGTYSTPAERTAAEIAAFQDYLRSNATIIYENGKRLGRGIRFSMRPFAATYNLCAERIWRVSASLQFQQVPPLGQNFILQQSNTFGSTTCGDDERIAKVVRTRPRENLLLPDAGGALRVTPLAGEATRFTSMTVQAAYNRSRSELENDPPNAGLTAFAGRGLYGEFVLVFPDQSINPGFDVTKLQDVLLRFQLVGGSQNPDSD
jgi:hypothetical protein